MANYVANISSVPSIILSQIVSIYADVKAADAAAVGSYNVVFVVEKQNADGSWSGLTESGLIPASLTQQPKDFSWSYTPTAIGSYRFSVSVRLGYPTYGWQNVTQTKQTATVTPIPVVDGFTYYVPLSAPPEALNIRKLVRQPEGHFLPEKEKYQLISGLSVVDDTVLDLAKQRRKFWAFYDDKVDHLNDELQRYVDSGVTYENGILKLTATPRPGTTGHAPSSTGIQYPLFDSGMIRSVATASFFFSHLRIKMPKEKGIWPAWWIIPGNGQIDPNPEMDMLEFVYNGANETANMVHNNCSRNKALLWSDGSYNIDYGYLKPSPTFYSPDYWVNRWVDICLDWREDGTMTTYHDGNPTAKWYFPWTYRGNVATPATMMVNLAIGGAWPTANWTTPVPTGPVTTEVSFLKTFTKISSEYGPPSPA